MCASTAKPRPIVQLLLDDLARGLRHQAERIAGEINQRLPIFPERMMELLAERSQRVLGIKLLCKIFVGRKRHGFTFRPAALASRRCRLSKERNISAPDSKAIATWRRSIVRCPSFPACSSLSASALRNTFVHSRARCTNNPESKSVSTCRKAARRSSSVICPNDRAFRKAFRSSIRFSGENEIAKRVLETKSFTAVCLSSLRYNETKKLVSA